MAIGQESEGRGIGGFMQRSQKQWEQQRMIDAQEEMRRQREMQAEEARKRESDGGGQEKKKDSGPASQKVADGPSLIKPEVGIDAASSLSTFAAKADAGSIKGGGAGSISPSDLYSYLIDRGATRNQAIMLTGAAGAESTWHPNLSHDKGTGYGLWGHRNERWDAMARMAGDRHPSWQKQADYALWELNNSKDGGIRRANAELARASTPEQIAVAQMHFERPVGYTPNNPTGGHNFDGRLKLVRQIDSGSFGGRATTPASPATQATPIRDAGTQRAQYAQAGAGTATDATPAPQTMTTPRATASVTTAQAQPSATTPGSQPLTTGAAPNPGVDAPLPPRRPGDLGGDVPLPPRRPEMGPPMPEQSAQPATNQPTQPQQQAQQEDGIGGFFKDIGSFFSGEPIKDKYGREWDPLYGFEKPPGEIAAASQRANEAAKANDAPSMLDRSSAATATSASADSSKSIFSDMPDIGAAFSPAFNFFSSLFG